MNDNKILIANEAYRSYNSLLENTTVMNRSRFAGSITHIDENAYWIEPYLKELYSQGMRSVQGLYQYRIKDLVFMILNTHLSSREN